MEKKFSPLADFIDRLSEKLILILLLLLAPIGVVASKGIVLLIALAGTTGFISWVIRGCPGVKRASPPVVILVLFFIWAAASSVWTLDKTGASFLIIRLVALCICGMAIIDTLKRTPKATKGKMENCLLAGYGLGIIALLIGYSFARLTDTSLWSSFSTDPLTTLNNGASVMSLLFIPYAAILWKRERRGLVFLTGILILSALFFLSSDASTLSLSAGIVVCILIFYMKKTGMILLAVSIVAAFLAMPTLTSTFLKPPPVENFKENTHSSADHRKLIWQFVNDRIDEKPLWGWGMDSSRDIPNGDIHLLPTMEILPLHPHNAALQIRLELGMPGIALIVAIILSVFFSMVSSRQTPFTNAVCSGVISSYAMIGSISYGVWQNWWIAFAWMLFAIVTVITEEKETNTNSQKV